MKIIIFPFLGLLVCFVVGCRSNERHSANASVQTTTGLIRSQDVIQTERTVERDRQVLEALLLHLLADSKFDMTRVSSDGAVIVLHTRTPEKTGFIQAGQMSVDHGDQALPDDAQRDLRKRNLKTDAKPDTYEAVVASFANLKFRAGIVVANLTPIWNNQRSIRAFEEAHPKARGWVESYLPGYSEDGSLAIVRAGVGPSPHGAMLTALLRKKADGWIVKSYYIAWYM